MRIRKASIKDSEGIAIVLKESYNIESIEEGRDVFYSERDKGINYIVAEDKGRIIGITTWLSHGLPKHGLIELDRIAVLPEYKGKGIGKGLFHGLIAEAKDDYAKKGCKLRKLYLLTHKSNTGAHKFYEKLGLMKEATLKKHYYDREDELVYSVFFN